MQVDEDRFQLFVNNIRRQTGKNFRIDETRLREMVKNGDSQAEVEFTPIGGRTVTY